MSNNQTEDFAPTPLDEILQGVREQGQAGRDAAADAYLGRKPQTPKHNPALELIEKMDASRARQIESLSQTEHGRKVLAGHGIDPVGQEGAQNNTQTQPPSLDRAQPLPDFTPKHGNMLGRAWDYDKIRRNNKSVEPEGETQADRIKSAHENFDRAQNDLDGLGVDAASAASRHYRDKVNLGQPMLLDPNQALTMSGIAKKEDEMRQQTSAQLRNGEHLSEASSAAISSFLQQHQQMIEIGALTQMPEKGFSIPLPDPLQSKVESGQIKSLVAGWGALGHSRDQALSIGGTNLLPEPLSNAHVRPLGNDLYEVQLERSFKILDAYDWDNESLMEPSAKVLEPANEASAFPILSKWRRRLTVTVQDQGGEQPSERFKIVKERWGDVIPANNELTQEDLNSIEGFATHWKAE